jgi:hypothetical protein
MFGPADWNSPAARNLFNSLLDENLTRAWAHALPHRLKLGPATAIWYSELGGLNKFVHIWPYKALGHAHEKPRDRRLAAFGRSEEGGPAGLSPGDAGKQDRHAGRFLADSIGKGKQSVDAVLHPAKSAAGELAIIAWALYVLLAAIFYHPDYPASVWPIAGGGILACLAVAANFGRWRLVVILASCIYLLFYAVRVGRMVALTSGFEISSVTTALYFYYLSSWQVTVAMLQERGLTGSLMHAYIEYVMPLLSVVLIILAWRSGRRAAAEPAR